MREAWLVALILLPACAHPKPLEPARSQTGPETVKVGRQPVDIAAGDLNEDGRLDLVAAAAGDLAIAVRLQDDRGWRAIDPLSVPVAPHLIALADLDGDRHLDIFATAHDSGAVWVWRGDGTGRFSPAPGSPFTAFARERPHNHGLAVGDLDGDGDADVVVNDQEARAVAVLLADGPGLKLAAGSPIDLGAQGYPPQLGDLDGDGRLDLAAPLVGGSAIALMKGDGAGGFAHLPGSPHPTQRPRPYGIGLGDLDGNGTLDVVAIHDDTDEVTVMLSGSGGTLIPLGRRVGTRVAMADMDRDGHLDLVAAGSGYAMVVRGDGRGGLSPDRAEPAEESYAAIAADFDGDGRLEFAAPLPDIGAVRIWR